MLDDPIFVGPMLTIIIAAFVVLLWPLSRQSAELIQLLIEERRRGDGARQLADIAAALERIETHLAHLEERQSFTEALAARGQQPVGIPASNGAELGRPRAGLAEG